MNIVGGNATGAGADGDGGAIRNYGMLTLNDCNLYGNQAARNGGAIWSGGDATQLVLDGCYLWSNQAVGKGGAIAVNDDTYLWLFESDVFANAATGNGADQGLGGGLYLHSNSPTGHSAFTTSRIYGNTAAVKGGGVYVKNSVLNMTDGELHGNSSLGRAYAL